jgi:hypothetical protein
VKFCAECKGGIVGDYPRFAAGTILTDGSRITREVNLHPDCLGPWMLHHYPWTVRARVVDAA